MSQGTHRFRQSELTRAIKAAEAAGKEICGAEISTDGRILLVFGKPSEQSEINELDTILYGNAKSKVRPDLP